MHRADQLRQQRKKGDVLYGFHEEDITFKPTYRFKKGTRKEYAYHKKKMGGVTKLNVPSWCDRVLYRSFPNQNIRQITYEILSAAFFSFLKTPW
jgi:phosphatidylinositol-3,4,5-trisphosphate 5-phosphatase 2